MGSQKCDCRTLLVEHKSAILVLPYVAIVQEKVTF